MECKYIKGSMCVFMILESRLWVLYAKSSEARLLSSCHVVWLLPAIASFRDSEKKKNKNIHGKKSNKRDKFNPFSDCSLGRSLMPL